MKDTVSIIVPVYNGEKTIRRCLESITNQTYTNLEIIVVNDGSKDNTETIISDIAIKDSRIRLISITNGGVSNARNQGLKLAKGKYIEFVDSDDYIDKDMVGLFVRLMEEKQVDFLSNGYVLHSKNSKTSIIYNAQLFRSKSEILKSIPQLYNDGILNTIWNKLYLKNKITSNFDCNIEVGEDLVFNLNYISSIDSFYIDNTSTYHYNEINANVSLSKKYHSNAIAFLNAQFDKLLGITDNQRIFDKVSYSDIYLREFIRILRKAIEAKATKEKKEQLIREASVFYRERLSNVVILQKRYSIIKSLLINNHTNMLLLFGHIVESLYIIKSKIKRGK